MLKHTDHLTDEESETNADRCQVGRLVLDDSQHDNDKHELGSQEHLDEETL